MHGQISIHDNRVVSYCVDGHARRIVLHTEYASERGSEQTDIVFVDVTAYYFDGDNFLTQLLNIDEVPAIEIFEKNRAMFEDGRKFAWPGPWNISDESVIKQIRESGAVGFVINPAIGMEGWVWARKMRLESR